MAMNRQCWKVWDCGRSTCPLFGQDEPECWTVATDCHHEALSTAGPKFPHCFRCEVFWANAPEETKDTARTIIKVAGYLSGPAAMRKSG